MVWTWSQRWVHWEFSKPGAEASRWPGYTCMGKKQRRLSQFTGKEKWRKQIRREEQDPQICSDLCCNLTETSPKLAGEACLPEQPSPRPSFAVEFLHSSICSSTEKRCGKKWDGIRVLFVREYQDSKHVMSCKHNLGRVRQKVYYLWL